MPDYILLMHNDASGTKPSDWGPYIAKLQATGDFQGGSAIGAGICLRKSAAAAPMTSPLSGFLRVRADSLDHARQMLVGNPVYEAGGTVEIRELPVTD
jgi:hypothetical protein